jgi:hypothetical protein
MILWLRFGIRLSMACQRHALRNLEADLDNDEDEEVDNDEK